uniref:Uncharacterized protein n=1 Tax=Hyaloperonospora arabidopsidis (strain Emoy2) TaxID=559515 RepID=M4B2G9_HYAAE
MKALPRGRQLAGPLRTQFGKGTIATGKLDVHVAIPARKHVEDSWSTSFIQRQNDVPYDKILAAFLPL